MRCEGGELAAVNRRPATPRRFCNGAAFGFDRSAGFGIRRLSGELSPQTLAVAVLGDPGTEIRSRESQRPSDSYVREATRAD